MPQDQVVIDRHGPLPLSGESFNMEKHALNALNARTFTDQNDFFQVVVNY